jgi:hypothetical protein
MELWLTLVALYAWQCMAWLRVPSAVFGPRWLDPGDLHRRGVHALSPWPSTLGVVAARLPFLPVDAGRAFVVQAGDTLGASHAIAFDPLDLERRGVRVLANGRVMLKASSTAQARCWADILARLAAMPAADRMGAWRRVLAESLDHRALAERLDDAGRATRWLARVCDVDLLFMGLGLPAAGLLLGGELVLAVSLPALGGLHVIALVCAYLAHRRLFPDRGGERAEEILMAALYPPALLRRPPAWVDAATAGFHPLAWTRLLTDDAKTRRTWLGEVTRLSRETERSSLEAPALRIERDLLVDLAPHEWTRAPERPRSDPTAASYCPICGDDFRAGFDRCAGCDVETIRYAASLE